MKISVTALFVFLCCCASAQPKTLSVKYYKNNGMVVPFRDSADYIHVVSEPDSGSELNNVTDYYKNGTRRLIGKIGHSYREGQFVKFYQNGNRESIINYKSNKPVGNEYDFYSNGKPYRVIEHYDNSDLYAELTGNYLIKENYDSLGTVQVVNGNGYYKGYDDKFTYVIEEGFIKNGRRDSLWKGIYKDQKTTFTETYKDGVLITGTATFDDGTNSTYAKTRNIPPGFKGGLTAFYKFLAANIMYPAVDRENGMQGYVALTFEVEKDGTISNIVVVRPVSFTIDQEAVRVLKKSPPWVPGTLFGRPASFKYTVPINFTLSIR